MAATTTNNDFCYDQFVIVAENECTTSDFKAKKANFYGKEILETKKFTLRLGRIKWEVLIYLCESKPISYDLRYWIRTYTDLCDQVKFVKFQCKDVQKGKIDRAHLEVLLYRWDKQKESYALIETPRRHMFTADDNSLLFQTLDVQQLNENMLMFNLRVLQDRSSLPDFTKASTQVGSISADTKLLVNGHTFHVNKQLLCAHSDYFDRMFNGYFREIHQAEVELKNVPVDPMAFHDFLLAMFVEEALPNPKNVADLFELADLYNAHAVRAKCDHHIRKCREMPIEDRVHLAGQFGDKKSLTMILKSASVQESKRANHFLFNQAFPHNC